MWYDFLKAIFINDIMSKKLLQVFLSGSDIDLIIMESRLTLYIDCMQFIIDKIIKIIKYNMVFVLLFL